MELRILKALAAGAAALALVACGGTEATRDDGAQVDEGGTMAGTDSGGSASTSGVSGTTGFQGHPLDDPDSLLSQRIVYFEFDKSDVLPEYRDIVEAHAAYVSGNPSAAITLEGHADERGTREYNVALGERRANSVMRLMNLLGAGAQQIRTISFGEERPAVMGHDEDAWSQNRRVEIVYRTR